MSNVVWISSESAWRRRLTKMWNGSMADLDFENRLERMYAQAPAMPDSDAFARRVEGRIDRSWTVRRWAIGAAGVAGVWSVSRWVIRLLLPRRLIRRRPVGVICQRAGRRSLDGARSEQPAQHPPCAPVATCAHDSP